MRRFLVASAAVALILAPTAASAQSDDAEVVAVHGIPQSIFETLGADSTAVDVYVADSYDAPLLTFEFGDTETLSVPAGSYTLEVFPAGGDTSGDPVLDIGPADLAAGSSTSIVAHLTEGGDPTLAAYGNETDGTGIQAFHTAAFGAVDIVAGGEVALEGVTNGQTARVDVPGGTTVPGVGVAPTGGEVAIEVGDVEVPADTLVLAYAIGSADDESLQVVATAVGAAASEDGGEEAADDDGGETTPVPHSVDAGTAGLASTGTSTPALGLLLAGAALLLAAPVTATVRARR